jgi:hypothetical protein
MIRSRIHAVVAIALCTAACHAFGAEILSIGAAETCGSFAGVRPTIDVDSQGQPHVVVDAGHTALGRTLAMFSRINGSWQTPASGPTTEGYSPSSMSQPWLEIDANDRLWLFAQFFTAGNLGQSGHGIWCYENITTGPTRSPVFGSSINGGTGFIKYTVGPGWGPGNISIDPYLTQTENAGVYIGSINGSYERFQYSRAATIVESGYNGPRLSGEKYRFRIAPREDQKGVYHGVMNGSLALSSAYWNSEIRTEIVWADVNSYYHQGDDHNHAGVCGDLANPSIGYMAAVFESSHDGHTTIQPGLNFNVWTGSDMVYNKPNNRRLGLLDSNAEFIHRYAPAMTPAHGDGGGCWLAWGDRSHQIWLGYIDQAGQVGDKQRVAHGSTCAINTDADGNIHLAYLDGGVVKYREITVSGSSGGSPITMAVDFDGDGVQDPTTFDSVSSTFHYFSSTAKAYRERQWGSTGDVPVPGNYDGGSSDNFAVYRPSTSTWLIRRDVGGLLEYQFGNPDEALTPVPADYDGDGKTDCAVLNQETYTWSIRRSDGSTSISKQHGIAQDHPVPGNYDGVAGDEIAIYRPTDYTWYWKSAISDGIGSKVFGSSGRIPAPADFNNDGTDDWGTYDPRAQDWYIKITGGPRVDELGFGIGTGDIPVPGDYDGDSTSDVAFVESSTGKWYIKKSSDGTLLSIPPVNYGWNAAGDQPVPDGYTIARSNGCNVAVYRPVTGTFYVRGINLGDPTVAHVWGTTPSQPVQGDFDGDGMGDICAIGRDDFVWRIKTSGGRNIERQFGWGNDTPVPGDYDGDGTDDIAVYRASRGVDPSRWYIRLSAGGRADRDFGWVGDQPVPGDYNGDETNDLAVYRPSDGVSESMWFITSPTGRVDHTFGWVGDQPVPGDYDGDNKTDVAVFRPANGTWYINKSNGSGIVTQSWGQAGDTPVPGDYDLDGADDIAVYRAGSWHILRSSDGEKMVGRGPFIVGLPSDTVIGGRATPQY